MRRGVRVIVGAVVVVGAGLAFYSWRAQNSARQGVTEVQATIDPKTGEITPEGTGPVAQYFPMVPGARWNYHISVGNTRPVYCRTLRYDSPVVGRKEIRGVFGGSQSAGEYELVLSVKGPESDLRPLESLEGFEDKVLRAVEIEVQRDDLGIYEGHQQVFWAVLRSDKLNVFEIITYPAGSRDTAELSKGAYSLKPVFIEGEPGQEIKFEQMRVLPDGLGAELTMGEAPILGWGFRRAYDASPIAKFGSPFTESLRFARNKGLIELRQEVGGETSMTWKLASSSLP